MPFLWIEATYGKAANLFIMEGVLRWRSLSGVYGVSGVSDVQLCQIYPPLHTPWEKPQVSLNGRGDGVEVEIVECLHSEYSTAQLEMCSWDLCLRVTVRLRSPKGAAKCPWDFTPVMVLYRYPLTLAPHLTRRCPSLPQSIMTRLGPKVPRGKRMPRMTSTRISYPGDPKITPWGQQLHSDLRPAFCSISFNIKTVATDLTVSLGGVHGRKWPPSFKDINSQRMKCRSSTPFVHFWDDR